MSKEFFGFARDFFGVKEQRLEHYEWVTVSARPEISANQSPMWRSALFSMWQADGWEIVSVTVLPPISEIDMCRAIGVLRKPRQGPTTAGDSGG